MPSRCPPPLLKSLLPLGLHFLGGLRRLRDLINESHVPGVSITLNLFFQGLPTPHPEHSRENRGGHRSNEEIGAKGIVLNQEIGQQSHIQR